MFAGNALCGLLFLMMQNITFWSLGMCRKHNRDTFLGFKWHRSFNFSLSFSLLIPILFYQILDLFFSFAEHLLGFILVGKFFGKSLRTRCLKKKVGSGTRFSYTCFFGLFLWPPWLNHAHSGIIWKISSPAQVGWHCCPRPCHRRGSRGAITGKWVKKLDLKMD